MSDWPARSTTFSGGLAVFPRAGWPPASWPTACLCAGPEYRADGPHSQIAANAAATPTTSPTTTLVRGHFDFPRGRRLPLDPWRGGSALASAALLVGVLPATAFFSRPAIP